MEKLQRLCTSQYNGHVMIKNPTIIDLDVPHLIIDCSILIKPFHIFCQLLRHFGVSKDIYSEIRSPQLFMEYLQNQIEIEFPFTWLILLHSDDLLRDEPLILWTLAHLSNLMPDHEKWLGLIFCIEKASLNDYSWVIDNRSFYFLDFSCNDHQITKETTTMAMCHKMSKYINSNNLCALIDSIYNLAKDQIGDGKSFNEFIQMILPLYLYANKEQNIPLANIANLYQCKLKQITEILQGLQYKQLSIKLPLTLNDSEKFLLISAYIASHNPTKYDLKLFGTTSGKRARIRVSKKIDQQRSKLIRMTAKAFPLERLMAIFYFIFTSTLLPTVGQVQMMIGSLINRKLLVRSTLMSKLDAPKFRSILSFDIIGILSESVNFPVGKYLASNL